MKGGDRPAYMRFLTTEGERFGFIESVDTSGSLPNFRVGPLMDRQDIPANAAIFELAPDRPENL